MIKSSNPHLAGGEITCSNSYGACPANRYRQETHFQVNLSTLFDANVGIACAMQWTLPIQQVVDLVHHGG